MFSVPRRRLLRRGWHHHSYRALRRWLVLHPWRIYPWSNTAGMSSRILLRKRDSGACAVSSWDLLQRDRIVSNQPVRVLPSGAFLRWHRTRRTHGSVCSGLVLQVTRDRRCTDHRRLFFEFHSFWALPNRSLLPRRDCVPGVMPIRHVQQRHSCRGMPSMPAWVSLRWAGCNKSPDVPTCVLLPTRYGARATTLSPRHRQRLGWAAC